MTQLRQVYAQIITVANTHDTVTSCSFAMPKFWFGNTGTPKPIS